MLLICAMLVCALAACAPTPTPPAPQPGGTPETLTLVGSTAAAPLLDDLGQAFQKQHPAAILAGSRGAYNAAQAQEAVLAGDLAWAAIAGSPSERLWAAPIAVDALAVIVHPDNPLSSLTLAQLQQVFSGRTWRWSELGVEGVGSEILVLGREVGSGTRAAFEDLALRERPERDPLPLTKTALLRLSSADVVTYVAEHPAAIGYVALGALRAASDSEGGAAVKVLAVEDVMPGSKQVAGGGYPLLLPIYLVARAEPTGTSRQFLDFCLSPAGQRLVARQYVPVRE
jgi:phosphate transport system substrate-binding protein